MRIYMLFLGVLFMSTGMHAQNNEHKGFILGFGVGPSLNSFDLGGNELALNTNFKIGYSPTNQLAFYWNSQVAWFSQSVLSTDKVLTIDSVGGLAGTYYLEEQSPSLYVNALLGFANWQSFEAGTEPNTGLGWGIGGGYEFARHWSADANLTFGKPKIGASEVASNTWAVRFSINYLMY